MISNLQPYPAYKHSGVPWLGQVPEHWEVLPGRAVFRECKDRGHPDELMLSVTITRGVLRQADLLADSSRKDSSNEDKSNYKLVQPGDLVYNKMRAWQGAVGVSAYRGIVSPAYIVQRLRSAENLPRYMHFLLRTPLFASEAERWSYGITSDQWSLRAEEFKCIYFSLPPLPEQTAIVRFLDWVDRRIRRYIRAKQKLIKLLEEYKQALIHQAVTGKIDVRTGQPYPAYKDSGVPWLGEVPEHWEVRRLRNIVKMRVSNVDKHSKEGEEPVRLCNYVDVYKHERIRANMEFMKATASAEEIERFRLEQGDVLITKDSEAWDDIGVPALVESSAPDLISGYHLALLRPKQVVEGAFLLRALQNPQVAYQFHVEAKGVTRYGLSHDAIKSVSVPLPPLPEQTAIVEYLDAQTAKLDAAIAAARREIELLREYRERLIADVVTGKLDVREVAARLPEESEEPDLPEEEINSVTDESEETTETMSADEETED
ncbi:restriction endonuclease subunit S [Hydrogenophilus thiooxidans]|uniref:restriction endonuclease subunit S n=1 Tax=Hydrogenophilus thiooxidans TaxID=2820326 RepID=UPI001C234FE0|nr:restriction endonuclease subunit S [Hydrogenophilus thiooxidans]